MFLEDEEEDTCGCGEEDCEECSEKVEKNKEGDSDDDYGDGNE